MAAGRERGRNARVGAGGAGAGTILIALANGLSSQSALRAMLLYTAPTVSLAFSTAMYVAERRVSYRYRLWSLDQGIATLVKEKARTGLSEEDLAHLDKHIKTLRGQRTRLIRERATG